jgi:hypothetical protein
MDTEHANAEAEPEAEPEVLAAAQAEIELDHQDLGILAQIPGVLLELRLLDQPVEDAPAREIPRTVIGARNRALIEIFGRVERLMRRDLHADPESG